MLETSTNFAWNRFTSAHPKLKELAIKAGVENNPQRAQELNCAYSSNGRERLVMSEAERELARYLYCREYEREEKN